IDPATLIPVLPAALCLGIASALTKLVTGYWACRRAGVEKRGGWRAGAALVARGEFSIVIAGLGASIDAAIRPTTAAYVLFLALLSTVLTRIIK
ncbi:MAG TPA: cation:proton antiporter, partial [Syntrophorhabdales bacterium]|nr:cation:proton antiporter [Syntrophorhabdales bacterium]